MRGENLRRNRLLRAGSHHATMALGRALPGAFPFVYLTGNPKSGTTWIGQMVADYLRIAFPRGAIMPIGIPAVIHGHYHIRPWMREVVYVMRDGRDVLTSLYFFTVRPVPEGENPRLQPALARMFPGLRNKERVWENMPGFIRAQARNPHASDMNWAEHVEHYFRAKRPGVTGVRYEDVQSDAFADVDRMIRELRGEEPDEDRVRWAVEKFTFEKQAGGRRAGQEARTNFFRKGQVGDWRNHFTREAARAFHECYGETLIRAGYETDASWVDRVPERLDGDGAVPDYAPASEASSSG
jgi:hypothetical protein